VNIPRKGNNKDNDNNNNNNIVDNIVCLNEKRNA
jgi:hypothetical protein